MAIEKKTIRLLILEDSQNEAERLVSLFRNAGHATRVHRLTSPEDLAETLQQSWDLLIAAPTSECLEPGEALATLPPVARHPVHPAGGRQQLRRHHRRLDARRPGRPAARRGRAPGAGRQPRAGRPRRTPRAPRRRTRPARGGKRCQLLLDSSVDAITYVHDGMHIYANRSYMALFGYEDAEELEGLPVIDLIASCDQGAFRISSRATRTTSARPNWFAPGSSSTARNSRRASASPPPRTTANPASRW